MDKHTQAHETSKQWIAAKIAGKRVLEVGGLGDLPEYERANLAGWQHTFVKEHAREVIGVDIDKDNLARAKALGFDYRYGDIEDATTLPEGPFDVILMIDVIEHLNDVGGAFRSARKLLAPGGTFVVSTPSPWALNNIGRILLGKQPRIYHDHTNYMVAEHFQQLASRHGLAVSRVDYFSMRDSRSLRSRIGSYAIALAGSWNPLLRSHIWVELK